MRLSCINRGCLQIMKKNSSLFIGARKILTTEVRFVARDRSEHRDIILWLSRYIYRLYLMIAMGKVMFLKIEFPLFQLRFKLTGKNTRSVISTLLEIITIFFSYAGNITFRGRE